MKKLLALLLIFIPSLAIAADNAVTLTPGSGVTMRTKDIGLGVQSPYNILGDASGAAIYGTAGTANANVLSVQGIASGTALPVSLASTTITGTVAATQSGTWTVQPGNTANTTAWLVTGTGGTFPVTQATAASLNATVVGTGTFAVQAAQSGTWNITNISGTISLPTGAATSANQSSVIGTKAAGTAASNSQLVGLVYNATPPTLTDTQQVSLQGDVNGNIKSFVTGAIGLAQGSTTSGQTGSLILGAVTTSSPTYTTAQTSPLSLDTSGNLRVNVVSGNGGATGFNVSAIPTIQNASYVSGNCMGGFQTVALGTTSSAISSVSLSSQGGLVTAKQVYIFGANPSGSTCTDKSTFTIATADLSKLIYSGSVLPAAPTGTTKSFGIIQNLALGVPSGGTVYAAIVETATETPASTTDLVLNFSGL